MSFKETTLARWLLRLIACAGLGLSLAAAAQEAADEEVIEEVIVTGSLIKRATVFEGRAPVQTIDATLIETSGAVQPVDILKNLTLNTGSEHATELNDRQGVSQFNLRGLGLSSSLTLLNGRRAGVSPVANAQATMFFDINTLPINMIERVEILRDGASATYGSEAVAGVANIITRKGFEGFEVSGGYRDAANENWDLGFVLGAGFDRGSFNVYGSYLKADDPTLRGDFDWLVERVIDPNGDGNPIDGSLTSAIGAPSTYRAATVAPDGTVTRTGRFLAADHDCEAAGGYIRGPFCRYDFSSSRGIIPAEERYQLFTEADYALTDKLTLLFELGTSNTVIKDLIGGQIFAQSNVSNGGVWIPANHPFNFWTDPDGDGRLTYVNPADWDPAAHEAVDLAAVALRPLGVEVNNHEDAARSEATFNNLRVMLGFEYAVTDDWTATGYFSQSNAKFTNAEPHSWAAPNFFAAIADGSWNPFGTRLANPGLVTPKTVADDGLDPANVGAVAANDAATLARFDATDISTTRTEQTVAEFVLSGDLFEMADGPVSGAFGTQYRRLELTDRPQPLFGQNLGVISGRAFNIDQDQDVWSVFGEVIVPLMGIGELQLALRHEDYGDAGSTTDPKLATQIRATDWLSLRGSWGTSFQAPSIYQSAGNTTTERVTDPFTAVGTCALNADGSIVNTGINNTVVVQTEGAGLGPQNADNFNLGVLLRPTDAVRMSIDYWNFDYEDVISQGETFQAIVDNDCLDDQRPNDPRVSRSPAGQIGLVRSAFINIGSVKTSGWDLNANYRFDTGMGSFSFDALLTLITEFDVSLDGENYIDQLGSRNHRNGFSANPELRYNVGVTWTHGNHLANATVRYIDSYANDEVLPISENPPNIDSWTTLDIYYALTLAGLFNTDGDITLSVGVNNLTDEDPPGLTTTRPNEQIYNLRPGYDGLVHDIRGRQLYARFRYAF
ncbi:MAG: TonB-dependent receptor [Gammaproteobacteria bacterium]|nr:TonB-dependent receptor [Gammaproteobacteria bacterium]